MKSQIKKNDQEFPLKAHKKYLQQVETFLSHFYLSHSLKAIESAYSKEEKTDNPSNLHTKKSPPSDPGLSDEKFMIS